MGDNGEGLAGVFGHESLHGGDKAALGGSGCLFAQDEFVGLVEKAGYGGHKGGMVGEEGGGVALVFVQVNGRLAGQAQYFGDNLPGDGGFGFDTGEEAARGVGGNGLGKQLASGTAVGRQLPLMGRLSGINLHHGMADKNQLGHCLLRL